MSVITLCTPRVAFPVPAWARVALACVRDYQGSLVKEIPRRGPPAARAPPTRTPPVGAKSEEQTAYILHLNVNVNMCDVGPDL